MVMDTLSEWFEDTKQIAYCVLHLQGVYESSHPPYLPLEVEPRKSYSVQGSKS